MHHHRRQLWFERWRAVEHSLQTAEPLQDAVSRRCRQTWEVAGPLDERFMEAMAAILPILQIFTEQKLMVNHFQIFPRLK